MKTSSRKINVLLKAQIKNTLAQAIADTKDFNESNTFLSDFLTESEYEGFAKRLAIAYWLKKGRSYNNIKNNLKVSTATIASVQTAMKKPGFQLALKKVEAEEWANQWSKKIKKFVK
jgi:TrpR-related protein YerC/YecD